MKNGQTDGDRDKDRQMEILYYIYSLKKKKYIRTMNKGTVNEGRKIGQIYLRSQRQTNGNPILYILK